MRDVTPFNAGPGELSIDEPWPDGTDYEQDEDEEEVPNFEPVPVEVYENSR